MRPSRGVRALVVLFVVSLPAVTCRIYASDEIQYFAFLRSIWFDRDVSFDNEYRYFDERGVAARAGFHATFLEEITSTGHRKTYATIGSALMWAPFYGLGDATARVLRALGRPVAVDGYSTPYIAAVAYGSAVYGFGSLLLSGAVARRLGVFSPAALAAVWLGTPLLFYMYLAPVFAHACAAFAVALLLWVWLRVRTAWSVGGAVLLGLTMALVVMVREQDAILAAGPALDFLRAWLKDRRLPFRRAIAAAAAGSTAFLAAYLPQALTYLAVNGGLRPSPEVTRKMTWTAPHAFEVLFSTEHGLIFWTPLALLAGAGLVWLALRPLDDRRWIAVCLLLMVGLNIYMLGSIESWTVAGAFGQRRFMSLTPLAILGVSAVWCAAEGRAARRAVGAALLLAVWWNLGLMIQFGERTMDRQRLTLAANARRTFFELPRELPGIAWHYFTNRSAFYGRPPQ